MRARTRLERWTRRWPHALDARKDLQRASMEHTIEELLGDRLAEFAGLSDQDAG